MSKKILKGLTAFGMGIALAISGASVASATTEYPDGGTWIYGVYKGGEWGSQGTVRSDYLHPSKTHKSTACAPGACTTSGWKVKAVWAYARHQPPNFSGGNTAYYDYL